MRFYRYVTTYWEEYGPNVVLKTYDSIKETPCGHWIEIPYGKDKWISNTSRKRFAYPTKEGAIINFIKRTKRWRAICISTAKSCDVALRIAEKTQKELEYDSKRKGESAIT